MWGTHELMSHRCCATTITNLLDVYLSVCLWANFVFVCVSMSAELGHMRDSRTDFFQVPSNDWNKQFGSLFIWLSMSEAHEIKNMTDSRTYTCERLMNWCLVGVVQRLEQVCPDVCVSICLWEKLADEMTLELIFWEFVMRRLTQLSLIRFPVYAPFCVGRNSKKTSRWWNDFGADFSDSFFNCTWRELAWFAVLSMRHSVSVEFLKSHLADEMTSELIFENF